MEKETFEKLVNDIVSHVNRLKAHFSKSSIVMVRRLSLEQMGDNKGFINLIFYLTL